MRTDISHENATIASFAKDKKLAMDYLNAVLEDGDQEEIKLALSRIAKAKAMNISDNSTKSSDTMIYQNFLANNKLELASVVSMLRTLGMKLSVCSSDTQLSFN